MFITKEQARELHNAGLGHVCLLNGRYVSSDGFKELSEDDMARVQEIVNGQPSQASATPTPKSKAGAPKTKPVPAPKPQKKGVKK
jgi:hypothetical protein